MIKRDLVILGGGSAGMSAAIEARKQGIESILIIEKEDCLGGILNQCIHSGFGLVEFNEELTGPEFLTRFVDQVNELGIEYKLGATVTNISSDKVVTYFSKEDGKVEVEAKAIIFTMGCYERSAGQIELGGKRISGVITAGSAQKYLNIYGYLVGKEIVILGSGDIGLIMARRMTLEGAHVICVCEVMPYCNGLARNVAQCLNDFNIPLYLSTTIKEVKGKDHVESVVLVDVDIDQNQIEGTEREVKCDTLMLSVGLIPYLGLLNNLGLDYDRNGRLKVNQYLETSMDGLFAAGNVLHVHDIVDYVVEEAREAGRGAAHYLKEGISNETLYLVSFDENISYIIPHEVSSDIKDDFTLKFRVKSTLKDAYIYVFNGEEMIYKEYRTAVIPSEMVMVKIKKEKIKLPLNLKVEVRTR